MLRRFNIDPDNYSLNNETDATGSVIPTKDIYKIKQERDALIKLIVEDINIRCKVMCDIENEPRKCINCADCDVATMIIEICNITGKKWEELSK